jgi:capsular exopolysaccharide synthesis family protein
MSDNFNKNINLQDEEESNFLNEFDVGKFGFILKKSTPFILLIFLVTGAVVFFYLRYSKPVYEASTIIKLEVQSSSQLLNIDLGTFSKGVDAINLLGEIELITSRLIYQGVIRDAELATTYYLDGDVIDEERYLNSPFTVDFLVKNPAVYNVPFYLVFGKDTYSLRFKIQKKEHYFESLPYDRPFEHSLFNLEVFVLQPDIIASGRTYHFEQHNDDYLFNYLASSLSVTIDNQAANTIRLSFRDYTPAKAIAILNAVSNNYLSKTIENKNIAYEQSIAYLDTQLGLVGDTLAFFEKQLASYKDTNKPKVRDDVSRFMAKVDALQASKMQLSMELENYERLKNYIQSDSTSTRIAMAATLVKNPPVQKLTEELLRLEETLNRIRSYYRSSTAAFRQREEEVQMVKQQLNSAIEFGEYEVRRKLADIQKELKDSEITFTEEIGEDAEFRKMNRFFNFYDNVFNVLLTKKIEIGVAKSSTVSNFRTLAPASSTDVPVSPVVYLVYGVGFVIALFGSFGLVVARYFLENKVNSIKELERLCAVPSLGLIPSYGKEMEFSQLIVQQNPKASITESFRAIRTNLEFIFPQKNKRLLSVTSTVSGEGKTFIAVNIAGVMALAGQKVVVLDLDMRKPKVHKAFNDPNEMGMSGILAGKYDWKACVKATEVEGLAYIPSGPLPPNPSELLMNPTFDELINQLKNTYDAIVFDTPPVGLVTDSIVAMRKCNVSIYVFRAGYSKLSSTGYVNSLAKASKLRLTVLLNGVDMKNSYMYNRGYGEGYGYGYGYGDGSYYDDKAAEPPKWKKILKWK